MATHPDLKRAMQRDGVPSLAAVEQAFGVAHRTLHRYRQADESEHIRTSRALDEWLLGIHRVIREGESWVVVPGPGPCAPEESWSMLRGLDEYLSAKADELAKREETLRALEREVLALRAVVQREASSLIHEGKSPLDSALCEILRENDGERGTKGLQPSEMPFTVVVMKLLDSLTLDRYSGDTTPVPDGKDVRLTLTMADIKFLDAEARKKSTSRNALVRAIVRKIREEMGGAVAA